jgi:hypothetical protein
LSDFIVSLAAILIVSCVIRNNTFSSSAESSNRSTHSIIKTGKQDSEPLNKMRVVAVLLALCLTTLVRAWTTTPSSLNRQDFMKTAGVAAASWFLSPVLPATAAAVETMPNGIKKEVIKAGTGPQPVIGELVAIRFSAYAGDNKIDDIFDTPEPYYTRMGSGNLIKGVEETLPLMKVGDRWLLTIPVRYDCRSCC